MSPAVGAASNPAELLPLVALHDQAAGPDVLQAGPRRVTRLPASDGAWVVCKEEVCPGWAARLRRWLLGSRARRAAAAARALLAAGIEVPEPLGALELPGRTLSFARFMAGPTLARALEVEGHTPGALLLAAARLTARLHAAGFSARDLKPQNLVLGPGAELVPVDLDDVRARAPDRADAVRNLAALDAYAQLAPRRPGVRARVEALRVYAQARELPAGPLLREVLAASRAKRARLRARTGGT